MNQIVELLKKKKTFNELSGETGINRRKLKKELQELTNQGLVNFENGYYTAVKKRRKKKEEKRVVIKLSTKRIKLPTYTKHLAILILPVLIVIMFKGWFDQCYPYQYQYSFYHNRINFILDSINNYGFIPSWSNDWYLGFPFLLYYTPLFVIITTSLAAIIGTLIAQNIITVLIYSLLPFSLYYFLINQKISKRISLITTFLFTTAKTVVILFLWTGAQVMYLGIALSLLGLSLIKKIKDFKSFAMYSILSTLVLLTHPLAYIFHSLMSLMLNFKSKLFRKTIIGLILSVLMSSAWLIPFIINLTNSTGTSISFEEVINIFNLLPNFLMENIWLIIIFTSSLILTIKTKLYKKHKEIVRLSIIIFIAVIFLSLFSFVNPSYNFMFLLIPISLIASIIIDKYFSKEIIIGLLVLLIVYAFTGPLFIIGNPVQDEQIKINAFELILGLSMISLLFSFKLGFNKKGLIIAPLIILSFINLIPLRANPNMACPTKIITKNQRAYNITNISKGDRVFTYPYSQGEYIDQLPTMLSIEITGGGLDQFDHRRGEINNVKSVKDIHDFSKIIGADHLLFIVRGPGEKIFLSILKKSKRFVLEESFHLGIREAYLFEVINKTGYTSPIVNYSAKNPEQITFFTNFTRETLLIIRESFFPKWRAYIEDRELVINETTNHFMSIIVPSGEQEIKLKYDISQEYIIGLVVTISGIIILFLFKNKKVNKLIKKIPTFKVSFK